MLLSCILVTVGSSGLEGRGSFECWFGPRIGKEQELRGWNVKKRCHRMLWLSLMAGASGHSGSRGEEAQMTHVCAGSWDPYTPASKTCTQRQEMNSQDAGCFTSIPYELLLELQHQGYGESTWRVWAWGGCFPFHTEAAVVMETLDLNTHGSKDRELSIFSHVSLGVDEGTKRSLNRIILANEPAGCV